MSMVNYDPKKFYVDEYGNLYPKKSTRPIVFKRLRKSPQPHGKVESTTKQFLVQQ